jgi:hypothetical protein
MHGRLDNVLRMYPRDDIAHCRAETLVGRSLRHEKLRKMASRVDCWTHTPVLDLTGPPADGKRDRHHFVDGRRWDQSKVLTQCRLMPTNVNRRGCRMVHREGPHRPIGGGDPENLVIVHRL